MNMRTACTTVVLQLLSYVFWPLLPVSNTHLSSQRRHRFLIVRPPVVPYFSDGGIFMMAHFAFLFLFSPCSAVMVSEGAVLGIAHQNDMCGLVARRVCGGSLVRRICSFARRWNQIIGLNCQGSRAQGVPPLSLLLSPPIHGQIARDRFRVQALPAARLIVS